MTHSISPAPVQAASAAKCRLKGHTKSGFSTLRCPYLAHQQKLFEHDWIANSSVSETSKIFRSLQENDATSPLEPPPCPFSTECLGNLTHFYDLTNRTFIQVQNEIRHHQKTNLRKNQFYLVFLDQWKNHLAYAWLTPFDVERQGLTVILSDDEAM